MASHECEMCRNDTGHSVLLSGLTDRCAYQSPSRCRQDAVYRVEMTYCLDEHCLYDPLHTSDCTADDTFTHVCEEHGLIMRTRPDLWQCFRGIRTLHRQDEERCDRCGGVVDPADLVQPGLGVGVGQTLHEECLLIMVEEAFGDG